MPKALIVPLMFTASISAADPTVDRKTLKPGLVASFSSMNVQQSTIQRLEPAVAFVMRPPRKINDGTGPIVAGRDQPADAMHPDQHGTKSASWLGYLQVVTPGEYAFSANAQAGLVSVKLQKDDQNIRVLQGEAGLKDVQLLTDKPVKLDAGFYRFHAAFDAIPDAFEHTRRFELFWQGPGFMREPIPYFFFGHLPSQRGTSYEGDARHDEGRMLFEEHGCINCHQPAMKAPVHVKRTGPDLTKIGSRAYPGWIDAWLADPVKLRPHTTMPKMFAETDQGRAERYAVTRYLVSRGGPLPEFRAPKIDANYSRSVQNGSALFTTTGCTACHGPKLAGTMKRNDDDDPPPPHDPLSSFYGFGSATGAQAIYALGGIGSKTTPEELAYFLKDPTKTNPHGRMPAMGLSNDEARDLARHLMRFTEESIENRSEVKSPTWKASQLAKGILKEDEEAAFGKLKSEQQWQELGRRISIEKGCANCHTMNGNGESLLDVQKPKAVQPRNDGRTGNTISRPRFHDHFEQLSPVGHAGHK